MLDFLIGFFPRHGDSSTIPKTSVAFLISQTIEMIEKEQREVERRPITKITHKGEIEIESQEPVKAPEPAEVRATLGVALLV